MRGARPPWKGAGRRRGEGEWEEWGEEEGGGGGVRAWVAVDAAGEARVAELGRQAVMRRTGLPARDLRILDPQLSYPSTVLGRERAIVVGLEHIKTIITAHEVLLLNHRDPAVEPFVRELQRRLRHRHQQQECEIEKGKDDEDISARGSRALPFEFIALEACLEAACTCLENEAAVLEKEAHPALDKLTSKISTLNLEHVRQIKSRLVAITGRVQKVRDELEHLLDDDDDMAEMYLTDKMMQQHLSEEASHSSLNDQSEGIDEDRMRAEISSEENDAPRMYEDELQNVVNDNSPHGPCLFNVESHRTNTYSTKSSNKHLDVQELEMLLEAYFVQIDSTLNKLTTLREYVDDTEDYINIMLDDKQNHLLQMGVMLTTATLIVSAFVALVGIFGMNIQIDLFDEKKAGMPEFLWTVGGSAAGSIILYVIAVTWCKRRRLLE
uniref:Magnesium transporter n=1 Tax=Ananas comosus var. bracteatus TaxID=296719 RepID=A0A6V7QE44_ANACO|nr:unnamed protein product [Ananas comosus var. bracteatus]